MKPEIKAKWVAALRSGEYKQGRDYLRNEGDTFCCLGVLCDIAGREGVGAWTTGRLFTTLDGDSGFSLPPRAVVEWAGLEAQQPTVNGGWDDLLCLNDTGTSFAEIADLIEAQL